ncbi:hypothetical protein GUITHDRAFT_150019 [Guillardia theta CCMP2712]|uniref:GRIP domain-containing protein n=1 Tax=Guillardia theta (strain CCMP2712) TaxID=905079 RepID=L1K270_GUITC|nr:hypothetical protein GUITHDRAFT_150019 [Guillardia theta CCMP2712]EKX54468.1 hypothetical protein GUITHDRAFT_150019 [Guillardia theta CCMP2712]|eukprot:XP_005841448.1 hypothetical protein GUITHDRAFT_150019 [Guillardia theta CCMP2712]
MFPRSATSQEEQILEMALVQAKRDEYVTKLNERISMLKENVAESRRVQDLLCKERDHLREQNEILRKEAATLHRVEKFESKFREGINIEYLKNVLIKYVETQDHEGLIPVFYSVLEFNAEERRRLENVRVKMSSPWSKLSRGKLF